jgi:DNA-binding NarL/FixJ family response regulator
MGGALPAPDVALIVSPLRGLHVELEAVRGPGGLPGILALVPATEIEEAARSAPALGISVLPEDADGDAVLAALHGAAHRLITIPQTAALPEAANDPLTEQQRRVLVLLAEGQSNKEISRALGISSNTTKFHVAALLKRLGVGTRTEAVAVGLRTGLIAA